MKIAVFPGTFNPIHIAHLIIAEIAREEYSLDKILFVPSNIPPHRSDGIADPEHRYKMTELSCKSNSFFECSDLELNRKGPSYTFDTLVEIKNIYPNIDTLYMIIGADAISQMHTWHQAKKLVDIATFLILPRPGNTDIKECLKRTGLKNFKYNIINSPLLEISSTLIRDNIKKNKSIKFLVLDEVKVYIEKNGIYKE